MANELDPANELSGPLVFPGTSASGPFNASTESGGGAWGKLAEAANGILTGAAQIIGAVKGNDASASLTRKKASISFSAATVLPWAVGGLVVVVILFLVFRRK